MELSLADAEEFDQRCDRNVPAENASAFPTYRGGPGLTCEMEKVAKEQVCADGINLMQWMRQNSIKNSQEDASEKEKKLIRLIRVMHHTSELLATRHDSGSYGHLLTAENILVHVGDDDSLNSRQGEISVSFVSMVPRKKGEDSTSICCQDLHELGNLFDMMLEITGYGTSPSTLAAPDTRSKENLEIPLLRILLSDLKIESKGATNTFGMMPYLTARQVQEDFEYMLKKKGALVLNRSPEDWTDQWNTDRELFGREREIKTLRDAFYRVRDRPAGADRSEVVFVSGDSGTGKSSLANDACNQIASTRDAIFLIGKFEQFRRGCPYSALTMAFTSFSDQLLKCDNIKVDHTRKKIKEAVGSEGRVLTDVIPKLIDLIGEQDNVVQLASAEAQNRFHFLFRMFVRAISSDDSPIILFLDDLQWADEGSIGLIKTLTSDAANSFMFFVGAYRDNEVTSAHPLVPLLRTLKEKKNIHVNKICIGNLRKDVVNTVVSDILNQFRRRTWPLTDIVYKVTKGNAFFLIQYLKHLRDEKLLSYSQESCQWKWNMQGIHSTQIVHDILELLSSKIRMLPTETQDVLKLAAAIGLHFDEFTLGITLRSMPRDSPFRCAPTFFSNERATMRKALVLALEEHLITPTGMMMYMFAHDRIQQAAYSLIPYEQRGMLHLWIGRLLLKKGKSREYSSSSVKTERSSTSSRSPQKSRSLSIRRLNSFPMEDMDLWLDRVSYCAVDQMNRGSEFIEDDQEKLDLSRLNLRAAEKSTRSAAFVASVEYLEAGLHMLGMTKWKDNYDLTLQLKSALAESTCCTAKFCQTEKIFNEVLANAKTFTDALRVYSSHMKSLGAQSRFDEAIEVGFSVLAKLGEPFPATANKRNILAEFFRAKAALRLKNDSNFLLLPTMKDSSKTASMKVLCSILPFIFVSRPAHIPLVASRMIRVTLQHGLCDESAFGLAMFALFHSTGLKDFKNGYRFAQLSLLLTEKLGAKKWSAQVHAGVISCCMHWREPIEKGINAMLVASQEGLKAGDNEGAMQCLTFACIHSFFAGRQLFRLEKDMRSAHEKLLDCGQKSPLALLPKFWQCVLNLMGRSGDPLLLVGDAMDQEESLRTDTESGNVTALCFTYFTRLVLAITFGDFKLAAEMAKKCQEFPNQGFFHEVKLIFYHGLTASMLGYDTCKREQKAEAYRAMKSLKKLASHSPKNCLHLYKLLKAGYAAMTGRKTNARKLYDDALGVAKKNGFIQDEAIAYEMAGRFYWRLGDRTTASLRIDRAHHLYVEWGARGKADQLLMEFPGPLKTEELDLHLDFRCKSSS